MSALELPPLPPAVEELLGDRLMPLGPGQANKALREQLGRLDVAALFPGQTIRDHDMARACLAGLWLYHDFLDESHTLSQEIASTTGSYWHGIMHRREGDFGNSKYWFRRVGNHPVFRPLQEYASQLAGSMNVASPAANRLIQGQAWDPFVFVDLVEAVETGDASCATLAQKLQMCEWRLLFRYSYVQAVGETS